MTTGQVSKEEKNQKREAEARVNVLGVFSPSLKISRFLAFWFGPFT